MTPTCTLDGCERPHAAQGLCSPHYMRWRMGSDLVPPIRQRDPYRLPCSVEGCDAKSKAKGFCQRTTTSNDRRGNDMGFSETRVLKAHLDAVEEAIRTFGKPYADDPDGFHHSVAKAVLTATDSTTRYVVIAKDGTGQLISARIPTSTPLSSLWSGTSPSVRKRRVPIMPLIPTPKVPRRKK